MSKIRILPILLLAAVMSNCTREELNITVEEANSDTQISFGPTAVWTKGTSLDAVTDISQLPVYCYYTVGQTWSEVEAASDLLPYFTTDVNTPFILTIAADGSCSYTGSTSTKYWPVDSDNKLSFIAYYPADDLTRTVNSTTGKPEFSYTMSTLANLNNDIVFDAELDMTEEDTTNGEVVLDLEHILTKLTLEVRLNGSNPNDGVSSDYTSDIYVVNGISFTGLYNNATLNYDAELGWTVDKTETIEVTASQGNTIVPIYTYDESGDVTGVNPAAKLKCDPDAAYDEDGNGYTSVMESGEAIFVLPQTLGTARTAEVDGSGIAPKVAVRIRRLYYTDEADQEDGIPSGELIYASESIDMPASTTSNCWEIGQWNNLQFTFDLDNLDQYSTPLTLKSSIYDWSDVDVDVNVHANTYIYSSESDIELSIEDSYADMYIYTNYIYDLRRHKRNIELDGSSTEAAGFTFYAGDTRCEPILYHDETEYYYVYDENNTLYLSTDKTYSGDDIEISQTNGIADLSDYEETATEDIDGDGVDETLNWMTFRIYPYPDTSPEYYFTYKAAKTTRDDLGLYTNSSIETTSSGINKSEDDAVYILRLDIQNSHLLDESGSPIDESDTVGYFSGGIGAELLSNGGGMITYKFNVSLTKYLTGQTE